jgi:hypothetical protein
VRRGWVTTEFDIHKKEGEPILWVTLVNVSVH